MKALISINETCQSGYRVAQVEQDENTFPVADSLFWVSCDDFVVADLFWYDPKDKKIKSVPQIENLVIQDQPITTGAETL